MKHRKKGRKIYTYQAKNRRVFSSYHPMRSAIGTVLTLIVVVVLGIVGYNIVGPVVTRLQLEAQSPTTTPEPYFTDTPPAVTGEPVAEASGTAAADTATTEAVTTAAETTTEPVTTPFPTGIEVACLVSVEALQDLDSVEAAAKACAEQGYTTMILPLKTDDGMLLYASAVEQARTCGASNDSMLTLREIVNAANRYGIRCTAQFSTLKDHTYSNCFMAGSYVFADSSTRWLDDKPEEGGKPWLNPFDDASGDYLSALAAEIEAGGFTGIICKDTVFPPFFQSDADLLGAHIMDAAKRKTALLSVLNQISADAPCAGMYVKLDELVGGTAEAYDAGLLSMQTLYVELDPNAFTEPFTIGERRYDSATLEFWDRMQLLAEAAQDSANGRTVIPCLSAETLSADEIDTAIKALQQIGCETVYVF